MTPPMTAMAIGARNSLPSLLPTAVGNSEGSEFRAPMAIAVIGGVISSTLLSLIVVPVVYLSIENLKGFISRLGGGKGRKVGTAHGAYAPHGQAGDLSPAPVLTKSL